MAHYYYLAASLPSLSLEAPPRVSLLDFQARCAQQLSRADRSALAALEAPVPAAGRDPFVCAWRRIEIAIRNRVARSRAARLGADAERFVLSGADEQSGFSARVAQALERDDPLERERELDRIRWTALDELAGLDPFSREALLAYAVKLRLAERWAALDGERGQQILAEAVDTQAAGVTEGESTASPSETGAAA